MNKFSEYSKSMSLEEKSQVISDNYRLASHLSKELANGSSKTMAPLKETSSKNLAVNDSIQIEPFDETFIKLYQAVISSSADSLSNRISSVISSGDINYFKYINMLKIKLYEDMISLSNLTFESRDLQNPEAQRMYSELSTLLDALDELEEEEELIATSQNQRNTLFFLTSLNRVAIYEDIDKDIPTDMYGQVLDLINGICKGEFKGLKYLHAKKMFEVRLGEVRITFAKLSSNKFLMLGCFLKKFVSNQSYRDMMYRTRDQYLAEKEEYLAQSDDEKFISEHQKYLDDIISLCERKGRVR